MSRTRRSTAGQPFHHAIAAGLRVAAIAGLALAGASCGDSKPATGAGGSTGTGGSTTDGGPGDAPTDMVTATPQKLIILHTNDIHSHLMGYAPEKDYTPATTGDDTTIGGMARLATAIGAARASAGGNRVLLLDAGDFMMGTLFELAATQAAAELSFMQLLGYDATTIGNHELDWTPTGLAAILSAAVTKQITLPIVASNMHFSADNPDAGPAPDGGAADDPLRTLVNASGIIKTKLVKSYTTATGTLKVGYFGLLGADAVTVTPQLTPLTFDKISDAATRMVADLRNNDKVDLVIALSHSGIDHNGKGEDADLAAAVPGIDIIISGHTHDTLAQPAIVNKTVIVTAGSYTAYLGKLEMTVTPGASPAVAVDKYTLIPIDDTIPGDATTQGGVDMAIAGIDAALRAKSATAPMYKQVIATTANDIPLPAYQEAPIGNLVTDAYLAVTSKLQPSAPPVLAVEGNGQLRADIRKGATGEIWFADLFRVLPIGIGPDQTPGYPLVTFYLNAKDIISGLELGAAAGPGVGEVNDQYFLQVAGIKAEFTMANGVFHRVTSVKLASTGAALDPTDLTTCYKVVATSYVAGLLGVVKSFTGGVLEVTAKDADCATPVNPTTQFVDADGNPANGVQQLHHWQALLGYVQGLPLASDASTIPVIPAAYGAAQGRIVKK